MGELCQRVTRGDDTEKNSVSPDARASCKRQLLVWWHLAHHDMLSKDPDQGLQE